MSTTATVVEMDLKPTVVTYHVYTADETVTDSKTNATSTKTVLKATMNDKVGEKAKNDGSFLFSQSCTYDLPGTFKGIVDLDIPEEEKVNVFRQGFTAKIGRSIVAELQEQDENGNPVFQPIEGNFDARGLGSEISGRRGLTDMEKAMKTLNNLPANIREMLLAQLKAQSPE